MGGAVVKNDSFIFNYRDEWFSQESSRLLAEINQTVYGAGVKAMAITPAPGVATKGLLSVGQPF
jgi:hypothetical protein